jgi:hypothetical protein
MHKKTEDCHPMLVLRKTPRGGERKQSLLYSFFFSLTFYIVCSEQILVFQSEENEVFHDFILLPFYKRQNECPEESSHLPKTTQLDVGSQDRLPSAAPLPAPATVEALTTGAIAAPV